MADAQEYGVIEGCPDRIEGRGQIFLDKCPYFIALPTAHEAPFAMCADESGGGECQPFTEWCRLHQLIGQAQEEIMSLERKPKTVLAFPDDVLLRNWKYYLQGLPYTTLVDLLKDAQRMGLNVRPLHRFKKKRKWFFRQEIESAFYQSKAFQKRLQITLKAYFCTRCGGRREGYAGRYNSFVDPCECQSD